MNPIVIHSNRSQVLTILRGAIAFAIAGVCMVLFPDVEIGIEMIGTIIGWICILFFGTIAIFALIRLNSTEPVLTIDSKGITDNASIFSANFIPWSDITGAEIVTFIEQKFLGISLRNPQKYLEKANPIKRLFMRMNSSLVGHIVCISPATFSVPIEELLAHVEHYLKAAKGR